jgi:hypothetical protein
VIESCYCDRTCESVIFEVYNVFSAWAGTGTVGCRATGHGTARLSNVRAVPGLAYWPAARFGTARLKNRAA